MIEITNQQNIGSVVASNAEENHFRIQQGTYTAFQINRPHVHLEFQDGAEIRGGSKPKKWKPERGMYKIHSADQIWNLTSLQIIDEVEPLSRVDTAEQLEQYDKLFWVDTDTNEVYVHHSDPDTLTVLDGGDQIVCDSGTIFENMNLGYGYDGVKYYGKDEVAFYNCNIHHCANQGIIASAASGGIGGKGLVVQNCVFSNIGKRYKMVDGEIQINNLDHGIYDHGSFSTIVGNTFNGIPHHQEERGRTELTVYNGYGPVQEGHMITNNIVVGSVCVKSLNAIFTHNTITCPFQWWLWLYDGGDRPCLWSKGNTINGELLREGWWTGSVEERQAEFG